MKAGGESGGGDGGGGGARGLADGTYPVSLVHEITPTHPSLPPPPPPRGAGEST